MFTHDDIMTGIIKRSDIIEIDKDIIQHIVQDAGIKASITEIDKPFAWIMQSQKIHLDDGGCLLLKIGINPEWTDASATLNQVAVSDMIRSAGIKQPRVLLYSDNTYDYGFRFILCENRKGERLCDIYGKTSKLERERLYETIGQAYSCIHSITNDWSGVWDGSPNKKRYPIHPSEFYGMAEFHDGSGKYLLEKGIISNDIFDDMCSIWDENLPYLKRRPSSFVHVSPFPWSIYINQSDNRYSVDGFGALGDFMWWDSMSDIAHLLYPPFLNITDEERKAFIRGYNKPLDELAIDLYTILNRLCAISGCYLAPVQKEHAELWIKEEINTLNRMISKLKN